MECGKSSEMPKLKVSFFSVKMWTLALSLAVLMEFCRGMIEDPFRSQFHQNFTSNFFADIFAPKNYKAKCYQRKVAQFAFVPKTFV